LKYRPTILVEYVKFRENLHYYIDAVFGLPLGQTLDTICRLFCPWSVRKACIVAKWYVKYSRRRYSWIGRWQLPVGRQMIPCLNLQQFGRNFERNVVACSRHPHAPIYRIVF